MRKKLLFFSIMLLLFACRPHKSAITVKPIYPPETQQLINWSVFNSEGLKNISFPNWFSSKMLDSFKIKSIELKVLPMDIKDSSSIFNDTFPSKRILLSFNKNGNLKTLCTDEFSNGIKIVHQKFSYPHSTDKNGYCAPVMSSKSKYNNDKILPLLNTMQNLQQYKRLVKKDDSDTNSIIYEDENDKKRTLYVFIPDSSNWNVTFIDSHFNPTEGKIFFFGTPKYYYNCFKLTNMVQKTPIINQSYYPTRTLKSQEYYSDGFLTKRLFKYDTLGLCLGYTDSLITTNGEFLKKEKVEVQFNNENLPKSLIKYHLNENNKTVLKKMLFKYTYR